MLSRAKHYNSCLQMRGVKGYVWCETERVDVPSWILVLSTRPSNFIFCGGSIYYKTKICFVLHTIVAATKIWAENNHWRSISCGSGMCYFMVVSCVHHKRTHWWFIAASNLSVWMALAAEHVAALAVAGTGALSVCQHTRYV